MPDAALYRFRKRRGLCPQCGGRRDSGWFTCNRCRAIARQASITVYETRWLAPGPNLVACCGAWHKIASVPCRLACCGRFLALHEETSP